MKVRTKPICRAVLEPTSTMPRRSKSTVNATWRIARWGWWQEPPDEHGRRRKPSPAVAATGEGTAEPRGQATESVAHLSTDASIRLRAEVA